MAVSIPLRYAGNGCWDRTAGELIQVSIPLRYAGNPAAESAGY